MYFPSLWHIPSTSGTAPQEAEAGSDFLASTNLLSLSLGHLGLPVSGWRFHNREKQQKYEERTLGKSFPNPTRIESASNLSHGKD